MSDNNQNSVEGGAGEPTDERFAKTAGNLANIVSLERICHLALNAFRASGVALVCLEDGKGRVMQAIGVPEHELPLHDPLPELLEAKDGEVLIGDIIEDGRLRAQAWVAGPPHARAIAARLLRNSEGETIGLLAILDKGPRVYDEADEDFLLDLSSLLSDELDRLGQNPQAVKVRDFDHASADAIIDAMLGHLDHGIFVLDQDYHTRLTNKAFRETFKVPSEYCETRPVFWEVMARIHESGVHIVPDIDYQEYVKVRRSEIERADGKPKQFNLSDGRVLEHRCRKLPNGWRLLTYYDVTERAEREKLLREAEDHLKQLAFTDTLTELGNRVSCQAAIAEAIEQAGSDRPFAMIQIDLDKFKRINDTLGHAAGDRLLQALGERLKLFTESYQTFQAFRWGGDEFIALVTYDRDGNLEALCRELINLATMPVRYEDRTLLPQISLGVARYPQDATSPDELMICADLALYETKGRGGSGFHFFNDTMKVGFEAEIELEKDLLAAMESGALEIWYQPYFGTAGDKISGLKSDVMWAHPKRGVLSYDQFMTGVTSSGLYSAVSRYIFDSSAEAAKIWSDEGHAFDRIVVNVDSNYLARGTVVQDICGACLRHDVSPEVFSIGICESVLKSDQDGKLREILNDCRTTGIAVTIRDFSGSYATLSNLSEYPVTQLRLGRDLAHNIANEPKQHAILSGMASTIKLIGAELVCEEIGDIQAIATLRTLGVAAVQGDCLVGAMDFRQMTQWFLNEGYLVCADRINGGGAALKV
ncbi:MAG: diguanylate cyclase [Pseudomonadota bacterium]